jgi:hypothetical protein
MTATQIMYPAQSPPGIGDIPCSTIGAITPSNTPGASMAQSCRWLWIGGAGSGNLKVTMVDGTVTSLAGLGVGMLKLNVMQVWSTGTDVTNIVGFI